jgi:hypothetical protein
VHRNFSDEVLSDLFKYIDTFIRRSVRGTIRIKPKLDLHIYHTRDEPTGFTFESKDRRRADVLVWKYNSRMLTLSWSILLHELGHFCGEETPKSTETYPIHFDDVLIQPFHTYIAREIEAWDWAILKWRLVPTRRRFPFHFMNACLDSYFFTSDIFTLEGEPLRS